MLIREILDSGDESDKIPPPLLRVKTPSPPLLLQSKTQPNDHKLPATMMMISPKPSRYVAPLKLSISLAVADLREANRRHLCQNHPHSRTKSKTNDDQVTKLLRKLGEKECLIMQLQIQNTLTRNLRSVSKNFDKVTKLESLWIQHKKVQRYLMYGTEVEAGGDGTANDEEVDIRM
ncbi:hypothetical protein BELL_1563g00010 [Botrytis elliptica]|uniref:Uncharacterized protein n=1 Tax=Botrytis elliptica TaxID=278938 RepID=A0A4Z1HXL3_9HELO|nr:hypothetical protein BELL_1563g00010 [Botrytis elliptica]